MAMRPEISVKNLMMQAFLTGWELSDKSISQDEYLQSAIQVIEVLQVEPESLYAEEGLGLPDGEEVDHLDDLLRADGQWIYYGVEAENFFLIQWYPDGGYEPEAREPQQRRELRQFQPRPAPLLMLIFKRKGTPSNAAFSD